MQTFKSKDIMWSDMEESVLELVTTEWKMCKSEKRRESPRRAFQVSLQGSSHTLQGLDKLKQHLKYMDLISPHNEIKPNTAVLHLHTLTHLCSLCL